MELGEVRARPFIAFNSQTRVRKCAISFEINLIIGEGSANVSVSLKNISAHNLQFYLNKTSMTTFIKTI